MGTDAARRAIGKMAQLCAAPTDLATLWQGCTEVLSPVLPHWWTPCWYTLDPASLLITSHYHAGLDEFPHDWLISEYYDDDVNQLADVVRSRAGIATLIEATGGQPHTSARWHRNMAMGGDQELIAALRTRAGQVWGAVGLYRAPGEPAFTEADKAFLRRVTPVLADGVRRALLFGQAREPDTADPPGLLILDEHFQIESTTAGATDLLSQLPDGNPATGRLPSSVLTLAARTLRAAHHPPHRGDIPVVRVLTRAGVWVALHGACLTTTNSPRIAIIVEPAHPGRIYPLLMSAYGLTDRERDITRLVLHGTSTSQIAAELVVSAHTVQQHLKAIFDKTGVRSRRELIGKIFFTHYEPRLRDNEHRVLSNKPLRGGPWPG